MKFTESWLKEWVSFEISAPQLAEKLTNAGLETTLLSFKETITFHKVIAGKVTEVGLHPRSEHLKVCTVDCGIKYIPEKTIVCGALNVKPGLCVAVALPGTTLAGGITIESRVMRGIESQGMLCSIEELGLELLFPDAVEAKKIWELPFDIPLGEDLRRYLRLDDPIFETHAPPNRGDCLSMLGIAREVGVLTQHNIIQPECFDYPIQLDSQYIVHIEARIACGKYTGCLIKGINVDAKTPFWIVDRLARSGINPIHPIVDVTNYVLLEWGVPLHAFDADTLSDQLFVRFAKPDESLQLLNGKTITLSKDVLVIADEKGPQALAGIMGGMQSAVAPHTVNIFLESAFFVPKAIAGRARRYNLSTDASHRFERGVDPNACHAALLRAINLILKICGGKASPIVEVKSEEALPAPKIINFKLARIQKLLGITVPTEKILTILNRFIVIIDKSEEHLQLQIPSWRFDIEGEVDIIEEIARIQGYDTIKPTLPHIPFYLSSPFTHESLLMNVRQFLVNHGYSENINYSFISQADQKLLDPNIEPVALENPITAELSVLRTNLWSGLLHVVKKHQHRQLSTLRFFEIGTVFLTRFEGIMEQTRVAGVIAGNVLPKQWGAKAQSADFFDLKKIVENSLQVLDPKTIYTYQVDKHPALHDKVTSRIYRSEKPVGWIGALHPNLYQAFDIDMPTYLFEWRLTTSSRMKPIRFQPFSKFPTVRRDLALWVPQIVTAHQVITAIKEVAGHYLQNLTLFDVYQTEPTTKKRSFALECIWQHFNRTLTAQEVDEWQATIVKTLQQKYNITLRDQ